MLVTVIQKTKAVVISNKEDETCKLSVNGKHWNKCNNTSSWAAILTDDGRCEKEVKLRIVVVKEAFWQHKELREGNLKLATKKRFFVTRK